jgi:hypothetical protein
MLLLTIPSLANYLHFGRVGALRRPNAGSILC